MGWIGFYNGYFKKLTLTDAIQMLQRSEVKWRNEYRVKVLNLVEKTALISFRA